MKIDDWFPEPNEILNCEKQTVQFLKDNFLVQSNFSKLAADAYRYYSRIKSDQKLKFSFESEFQIDDTLIC